MMDMMDMTFYWGKDVTILFDFWRVHTWPWYVGSLLIIALTAALAEGVSSGRAALTARVVHGEKEEEGDRRAPLLSRACSRLRGAVAVGALYGLQTGLWYLLMLAAMTFNGGVFVAIVVGFAVGHALFLRDEGSRGKSACGVC